jgi:DNA-binding LytR/AlgR family response regulator
MGSGRRPVARNDSSSLENDRSFAFGDSSWQERPMSTAPERLLLHLGRDRRRAIDPTEVYFLEATGETTLVRLRSSQRLRDVRALGELLPLLAPFGILRVHRNHGVNVRHVLEVRRRSAEADWEVKLESPVNALLPVGRTYLKQLWAAFGER